MSTVTVNPPETAPAPAVKPVSATTSTSLTPSTQVSLSLDLDTYTYFETKAAEDDRTVSKFIARTLKAYVAERAEKTKKLEEKF